VTGGRINDKEFNLMALDGKSTNGLTPNKTNWAAPIKVAPFYGYDASRMPIAAPGSLLLTMI
jgi:tricarballylate dehydrogenase